ncbi:organic solute transporter Ostalpha-domain-containing protein [Mycena albidolilacea]|uniref:Organic solute transporter Ostalpha-domain-containing protein n=1 Tax=Mycena albidolilacea TaxID=1033008 RepID=A0AAD6YYH5_9AGAR|nr:organic solute transporter Ostalpha-domain-containing protein [Mycena albidolilacea]
MLMAEPTGGAGSSLPTPVLLISGLATLVAVLVSGMSVHLQLRNYRKPALQRMVVRIMIMVPLYAVSSLISLFSLETAFFINAIRGIYEAFVIYAFFTLLLPQRRARPPHAPPRPAPQGSHLPRLPVEEGDRRQRPIYISVFEARDYVCVFLLPTSFPFFVPHSFGAMQECAYKRERRSFIVGFDVVACDRISLAKRRAGGTGSGTDQTPLRLFRVVQSVPHLHWGPNRYLFISFGWYLESSRLSLILSQRTEEADGELAALAGWRRVDAFKTR